jgi:hypothetical protein
MRNLRFLARTPCRMLLAFCVAISGCSDEPDLPPEVEEAARLRAEEEERAEQELERERERLLRAAKESEGSRTSSDPRAPSPDSKADDGKTDDAIPPGDPSNDKAAEISDSPGDAPTATVEPPATPTPPVPPRNRTTALKWSQMKAGMTTAEVHKLLGPPTRQANDSFLTYWYYGSGRMAGKVAFIRQSQRTMAWDPPVN